MKQIDPPIENLLSEYDTLVVEASTPGAGLSWECLRTSLVVSADWSSPAADHLVTLVRNYGSFVLRNAYALALATDIEDGELGI